MNLVEALVRIGSIIAGAKALKEAFGPPQLRGPTHDLRRALDRTLRDRPAPTMRRHEIRSLDDRIKHLRALAISGAADPTLRMMTARLLARKCGAQWCIPERDYPKEIRAVFSAVRQHVRYTRDTEHADLYQHPLRTLQSGAGDCDDFSSLLAAMLLSIGYPVHYRVIRSEGARDWNHIYVMVGLPPQKPERWVALDATVAMPPGWQSPRIAAKRDFPVTT